MLIDAAESEKMQQKFARRRLLKFDQSVSFDGGKTYMTVGEIMKLSESDK